MVVNYHEGRKVQKLITYHFTAEKENEVNRDYHTTHTYTYKEKNT